MASSKLQEEITEDYLEEDKPITGQKYVCLSFISPENVLDDKKTFYFYHYMKSVNTDYNKTYNEFKEDFRFFQEDNSESLQEQFDDLVEYKTNVRGVKVRGVYDNIRAANVRAKVLQKMDRSFHVYVGQVGYWLPWDPTANNIEEQEYAEPELNRLVKEYKKNETKKDMFYEEQKREKIKAAKEEALRKKKENEEMMAKNLDSIDDYEIEKIEEEEPLKEDITDDVKDDVKDIIKDVVEEVKGEEPESETPREQSTEEPVKDVNNILPEDKPADVSSENVVSEEIRNKLEGDDPWMQKVQREEDEKKKSE